MFQGWHAFVGVRRAKFSTWSLVIVYSIPLEANREVRLRFPDYRERCMSDFIVKMQISIQ